MCGALRYIQQHATDYDPDRTYVVNLDGIGAAGRITLLTSYGIPPVVTSKGSVQKLLHVVRKSASKSQRSTHRLVSAAINSQLPVEDLKPLRYRQEDLAKLRSRFIPNGMRLT